MAVGGGFYKLPPLPPPHLISRPLIFRGKSSSCSPCQQRSLLGAPKGGYCVFRCGAAGPSSEHRADQGNPAFTGAQLSVVRAGWVRAGTDPEGKGGNPREEGNLGEDLSAPGGPKAPGSGAACTAVLTTIPHTPAPSIPHFCLCAQAHTTRSVSLNVQAG